MTDYTPASERRIFTGACSSEECKASMAIWPHWERLDDLPDMDEWGDPFIDCPVCGESMQMDWIDPMTVGIPTGYDEWEFKEAHDA